jgi:formylglycine-generating enzyme required for sulfatase activity/serine/threonine protein kinase
MKRRLADLSDDDRQVLESWLVAFDQHWDERLLASRAAQLPPGSSWRLPALAEMVKIDLERQWQRGRQASLESYLREFPELGRPEEVSADLIQAEYEVRRLFGAPAVLDDYLRRFPHQATELARLIARGDSARARRSSPSAVQQPAGRPAERELPEQFGRYRILKRLGQGGMGSVYLAEDTQLGRRVALKVAHAATEQGSEARKRLLAEARAAATLDHPYLCPVHDVGEIDGRLYLTMAYIDGQSLAELSEGNALPPRQVAALVGKLALALQEAHAKGVIHRDLKPSNIMIKATRSRREPVIVDFGLARRESVDEARLTRSGQIMGTPDYMAPEQIRGNPQEIGPACDIYALGVILYELLTGRLPFTGTGLAVIGQILTQEPLPPATFRPDLDPRLEAICLTAMARTVSDRFASMAALAASLTEYLRTPAPSPAPASPSSASPPPAAAAVPPTGSNILVAQLLDRVVTPPTPAPGPPVPGGDAVEEAPAVAPGQRPRWTARSKRIALSLFGGLIALGIIITIGTRNGAKAGFVALFNGKDLTGWKTHPSQPGNWRVENGILIGSGSSLSHLYTERDDLGDFHLRVKARINNHGSGGVCFRTQYEDPSKTQGFPHGFGAQISSARSPHTGSLWMIPGGFFRGGISDPTVPAGQWFTLEVIATGDHIVVMVDGKITSEVDDDQRLFSRGHIALEQADPEAKVEFSAIEIKELNGSSQSTTADPAGSKVITNSIGMKLALIPAGDFWMGSPYSDTDAVDNEYPRHRVRITRPFYLGVYEVTRGQYGAVMGELSTYSEGSVDLPMTNVSWNDALAFCNKLSEREGLRPYYRSGAGSQLLGDDGYRLPTEAEWEYACRAGSATKFSFGDVSTSLGEYAWYAGTSGRETHPVGQKRPNAFGLYDMHGNVWEWCWDGYEEKYYANSPGADPSGPSFAADRVNRGGGWRSDPKSCRSAVRDGNPPGHRNFNLGFRVARVASGR